MALSMDDPNSRTRRGEAAPDFYQSYLNSPAWRSTRNDALRRAKYTCERCGRRRDLNVHHKTYERLGAERPSDLEVVCFVCHNEHHREEAAKSDSLGIYLKIVSSVLSEHQWATVADLSDAVKSLCATRKIPVDPPKIAKAISLVCATRLKDGDKPFKSAVEVDYDDPIDDRPFTHAQAVEFLARLGSPRVSHWGVKSIPHVTMLTQAEADRRKALEMVAKEMQASIERCAALERQG